MKKQIIKLSTLFIIAFTGFTGLSLASNGTGGSAGGSAGMTWQEIKVATFYKADFPYYEIEDYNVSYDDLCMDNFDIIRTKKQYLVDWKFYKGSYVYQYDFLSRPREIVKRVCIDINNTGHCVWEEIVDSIPQEQTIKIHRYEEGHWLLDDTRNYQLDACENFRSTVII